MEGLAGQVALVTGAASGIGRASAVAFARAGAAVAGYVRYRNAWSLPPRHCRWLPLAVPGLAGRGRPAQRHRSPPVRPTACWDTGSGASAQAE